MKFGRIGRRDENELGIIDALRAVGATVKQLHEPADLLVGYRGANHLLEVKQPLGPKGGKPRSERADRRSHQRDRRAQWCGCIETVRTPAGALEAIGVAAEEEIHSDGPGRN